MKKKLDEIKIKLVGGRSTAEVYKVDEKVLRTHQERSDFANEFLKYLESKDFKHSQRFLYKDNNGFDHFKYIKGYVPIEIGETSIEQLVEFMKIVRQMHDLGEEYLNNGKVICHNDLSPCNVVFINNEPEFIIDWDGAEMGERSEDIVYILWLWINIGSHNRDNINILEQIKIGLEAYGANENIINDLASKFIERMDKVQNEMRKDHYEYKRTVEWVAFSKLWINEHKDEINNILVK